MVSNRYIRQTILPEVGQKGQNKLLQTSVIIVGCGGLGIPAALYLAGSGIGTIHLVDFDAVELSNLHRQVIYKEEDIGKNKAIVLAKHLSSLNSEISVIDHSKKLTETNVFELFADVDYVLDCTDNLMCRYLINDACVKLDKAFISASIYKYEGQLGLFNYQNGPTYRCIHNATPNTKIISCNEGGVINTLPAQMGILQATELLKVVLNLKGILDNKLMIFNILTFNFSSFSMYRNEELYKEIRNTPLKSYSPSPNIKDIELVESDLDEFIEQNEVVYVDVREHFEEPKLNALHLIQMPLSKRFKDIETLDSSKVFICFCQSGIRSLNTAIELRKKGFKAYSLSKGITSFKDSSLLSSEQEIIR